MPNLLAPAPQIPNNHTIKANKGEGYSLFYFSWFCHLEVFKATGNSNTQKVQIISNFILKGSFIGFLYNYN